MRPPPFHFFLDINLRNRYIELIQYFTKKGIKSMCENEKMYSVPEITGLLDISVASLHVYNNKLKLEPHYTKDGKRKRLYTQSDYDQLKNYIETK